MAVTDEPTRFFIVHLQKTAGTSLRDRFRATFADTAIYPNASDGRDKRHLRDLGRRTCSNGGTNAGTRSASSPATSRSPPSSCSTPTSSTLSILRAPVERTLSYLRHQKKLNRDDRERSLEAIYDDPFRFNGLIRNHMVRMFSIGADEMAAGDGVLTDVGDSRERLERAKDAVAGLDGFGLQPRSRNSGTSSRADTALRSGEPTRSNTTEPEPAPAALIERIERDNALDKELFDYAEDLYQARRRSH